MRKHLPALFAAVTAASAFAFAILAILPRMSYG